MEFKKYYLYELVEDKEYQKAYELWVWYYYMCKLYSQMVYTGRNKYGEVVPIDNYEMVLINRNAKEIMQEILFEKERYEIDRETWELAKNNASRLSWKNLQRRFER